MTRTLQALGRRRRKQNAPFFVWASPKKGVPFFPFFEAAKDKEVLLTA